VPSLEQKDDERFGSEHQPDADWQPDELHAFEQRPALQPQIAGGGMLRDERYLHHASKQNPAIVCTIREVYRSSVSVPLPRNDPIAFWSSVPLSPST
jgi:hypothetical protein